MWDTNIFSCEQAVGDERLMAVKGTWKGIQGDIYLVCIYRPHVGNQKISLWDRLSNLMNTGEMRGACSEISTKLQVWMIERIPHSTQRRLMSLMNL